MKDFLTDEEMAQLESEQNPSSSPDFISDEEMNQLESQNKAQPDQPSKVLDFTRGAIAGATFDFQDEIEGGAKAAFQKGKDFLYGEDSGNFEDIYKKERDLSRQEDLESKKRSPLTYLGGQVVGSVLLPGGAAAKGATTAAKLGKAAVVGTAEGMMSGLGSSEKEDLKGLAKDTGIGGLTGGIVGTAGSGISALAGKISKRFIEKGGKIEKVRDHVKKMLNLTDEEADAYITKGLKDNKNFGNIAPEVRAKAENTIKKGGFNQLDEVIKETDEKLPIFDELRYKAQADEATDFATQKQNIEGGFKNAKESIYNKLTNNKEDLAKNLDTIPRYNKESLIRTLRSSKSGLTKVAADLKKSKMVDDTINELTNNYPANHQFSERELNGIISSIQKKAYSQGLEAGEFAGAQGSLRLGVGRLRKKMMTNPSTSQEFKKILAEQASLAKGHDTLSNFEGQITRLFNQAKKGSTFSPQDKQIIDELSSKSGVDIGSLFEEVRSYSSPVKSVQGKIQAQMAKKRGSEDYVKPISNLRDSQGNVRLDPIKKALGVKRGEIPSDDAIKAQRQIDLLQNRTGDDLSDFLKGSEEELVSRLPMNEKGAADILSNYGVTQVAGGTTGGLMRIINSLSENPSAKTVKQTLEEISKIPDKRAREQLIKAMRKALEKAPARVIPQKGRGSNERQ